MSEPDAQEWHRKEQMALDQVRRQMSQKKGPSLNLFYLAAAVIAVIVGALLIAAYTVID